MKPSQETQNQWSNDPNNWKWGVFILIVRTIEFSSQKNTLDGLDYKFCQTKINSCFPTDAVVFGFILYMIDRKN